MGKELGSFIEEAPPLLEQEWTERAEKLSTSLISDVMGRFSVMDYSIKPIVPGMKIAGTAFTVNARAADNLYLHKALRMGRPGYILVTDGKGHEKNALWGEIMTSIAMVKGLTGLVLDGVVRDIAALREKGFPVFCKGAHAAGPDKDGPGEINGPISCGGVVVNPGDLILADDDGVVVVPRAEVPHILDLAEKKAEAEDKRLREIARGIIDPK